MKKSLLDVALHCAQTLHLKLPAGLLSRNVRGPGGLCSDLTRMDLRLGALLKMVCGGPVKAEFSEGSELMMCQCSCNTLFISFPRGE